MKPVPPVFPVLFSITQHTNEGPRLLPLPDTSCLVSHLVLTVLAPLQLSSTFAPSLLLMPVLSSYAFLATAIALAS